MSIQMSNRVRELEINVEQLKDMIAAIYQQIKELTESQQSQTKANKR